MDRWSRRIACGLVFAATSIAIVTPELVAESGPTADSISPQDHASIAPRVSEIPARGDAFPSGLEIGLGVSAIPTIYGWLTGISEHIGYHFAFGRIFSAGVSGIVAQGAGLVEGGGQPVPFTIGLEGSARAGFPVLIWNAALFPFIGVGVRAGFAAGITTVHVIKLSMQACTGFIIRPSTRWSIGISVGTSFAIDNSLRLDAIPIGLFMVFE